MGAFLVDKTGLAMEAAQIFTEKDGVSAVSRTIGAVKITDVKIRGDWRSLSRISRVNDTLTV